MKARWLLCALLLSVGLYGQQFDPATWSGMRWRMIGPFRGGRTVPAAGIPNRPNVFFIGVNNGGVWKTTDYGRTWESIFDREPTQSIGAVALAPSDPDILYVGSGEGLQRPDLSVGDGIYKSTDGGKTWRHLGLRDGQQIPQIIVDPRDPNRLFVAVLGHPYGPNPERGIFRSLDGGRTFEKVLYKNENVGGIDLAFDPRNAQTVYAALWAARRPPWSMGSTFKGPGSGLFKSTDGGTTWTQLTQGLPTYENGGLGRIGIGIAPGDPRRIYALVDADAAVKGLYRSDDAGASWRRVNHEERVVGRGDDFAEVKVDPSDPNTIYVANTSTYKSTDGGASFVAWKGAPGGDDYHRIWINPENSDIVLLGADQGATLTVNGGRTWSSWYNQPTAQFYHVSTDDQFPYHVCGGQQESGSACTVSRSDYGEITFRDWRTVGTEEYGYVAPDPLHPNLVFGGKVSVYDMNTSQTRNVSPVVLRAGQFRFNRTAPLLFSPVDKRALYLGSNVLFKTTDGGESWRIISPDLTRPDPGMPPSLGIFSNTPDAKNTYRRGVIYSIGLSWHDANVIWIGTDDGLIQVTRGGGGAWRDVTPPELTPWSKVAQIEVSHFDDQSAYAAVNRLRVDDLGAYIYRTHDGGRTWRKIVNGLPASPVNAVREDPERKGLLYAATETGVWVSFDDGDQWQSLQFNLPATSVRDLVVHGDDLVVGTHGRSFWILDDVTPLRQSGESRVASPAAVLFRPQTAVRVRRSTNTDTPLPPEVPAGQNPPDGAILNYWVPGVRSQAPGEQASGSGLQASGGVVVMEILDSSGKLVRRWASNDRPEPIDPKELNVPMYWIRQPRVLPATPGMHRWVWDLHYATPQGLRREPPISAIPHDTPLEPRGPRALPGQYTVRLTAGGSTLTDTLTVRIDPRVTSPEAALRAQFEMETALAEAMDRTHAALRRAESARTQLEQRKPRAPRLAQEMAALEQSLGALVGGRESLAQLQGALQALYENVDSADAGPTTQTQAAWQELRARLDQQLARWAQAQQQIAALNGKLRAAGLPEIQPK
jgi:photosystem II stability/assembly factor-like uncharacterized protein